MIDPRIQQFKNDMDTMLQHLLGEFAKLQTGRANAALVEHIEVEAYGQKQQIRAVAGVSVSDTRTIVIQPWDRAILQAIEKAIQVANLGSNPMNDGAVIRISLPSMTTERRTQLTKIVHQLAEDSRIAVRKHRQAAQDIIKADKDEDIRDTLMEELQKAVDEANAKIAEAAQKKEDEVMKV
jgi:ribosome recycling factor